MIPFRRIRGGPAARAGLPSRRHEGGSGQTRAGGLRSSETRDGASGGPRGSERAEREADGTARRLLDNSLDTRSPDHPESGGRAGDLPHAEVPAGGPEVAGSSGRVPGGGRPLNDPDLLLFRRRLGADLSAVRVHDDAAADRATREEHASGYTIGEHVVLGADADRAVLAHELVHVLQQRRAGRTAVQRQELPRRDGVGRVPPAVDFDVVRERAPSEDVPVLFANDSVSLAGLDLAPLVPRLSSARPLMVDIDGYASNEGDPEYNVNLSAHRAAAVRAVLLALLPEGSTVRLHAHGSTIAFGQDGAANRRVGIRVTAAPIALGPFTLQPPGNADQRDRFRLVPDLQLHLDPRLAPLPPGLLPPGVLPPLPDVRLPEVRLGDSLPGHRGPFGQDAPRAQGGPALDPRTPVGPWVGPWREGPFTPVPPPGPEPLQPPQLFPRLTPGAPVVDWGALRQTFTDHGAGAIDPRFAASAQAFTEYWYDRYRAMGLPEERARQLANLGTRIVVGRELGLAGATAADRIDNELRRQGLPTPLGGSVDLLDLLRRIRGERGGQK